MQVKAQFKRRSNANNVEIYVPVPDDADTPKFRVREVGSISHEPTWFHLWQAATGTAKYVPDKSAFVWTIKQLGGSREFLMRAQFGLPSVRNRT